MRAGPVTATYVGKEDLWTQFCFIVVRMVPQPEDEGISYKVVVKSPYLLTACKDVIQDVPGLSWNSVPLEVCLFVRYECCFDTRADMHVAVGLAALVDLPPQF